MFYAADGAPRAPCLLIFFFNNPATTEFYTLSLHDALPILPICGHRRCSRSATLSLSRSALSPGPRSEEHTSELQSRFDLVCRLLLEKKKTQKLNLLLFTKKQKIHI